MGDQLHCSTGAMLLHQILVKPLYNKIRKTTQWLQIRVEPSLIELNSFRRTVLINGAQKSIGKQ